MKNLCRKKAQKAQKVLFVPSILRAAQPNDIRFQQFDGLQWNWIELRPTNNGAITFDGSLQFKSAGEKQDAITTTTSITPSNIVATGFLSSTATAAAVNIA
jgi:hypothetical protein